LCKNLKVAICLRLLFITIYGENDFKSLRYNLKDTVMYISHCRAQKSVNEKLIGSLAL